MVERRRIVTLVVVLILVAVGVGGTAMWSLYQVELQEKSDHLRSLAQAQVRFIEGAVDFESVAGGKMDQEKVGNLIRCCFQEFPGFGQTGEFIVVRRCGEMMEFVVHHRREKNEQTAGIPFLTPRAEPMRRALLGQSGVMRFADCQADMALAAYEPIDRFGLALVTKISMAELRQPFLQAAQQLILIASLLVLSGSYLFWRITRPLLRQLESKELRYRTLFENTADAVFVMRGKTIIEANGQSCCLLGIEEAEIIGQSPAQFSPEFQADGRSSLAATLHYVQAAMRGARQYFTWQYLCNGQLREADMVLQGLQLDGDDVVLATMRDVTDIKEVERSLRERERHYRAIFERGSNGFFLYRRNGQLVDVNPAACRMYGCEREELLSLTIGERLHGEDCESYLDSVDRTIDSNQGCHMEVRGLHRDGSLIHFEVSLEAFLWRGELLCLATTIDVSERKKVEKAAQCEETRMEALLTLQQMLDFPEQQVCSYLLGQATLISESVRGFLAVADTEGQLKIQASTLERSEDWFVNQLSLPQCRQPLVCNHLNGDDVDENLECQRYLQVPLLEDGQIVAVIGLADREDCYSDFDVRQLLLLLQGTWQRLQRNRAVVALKQAKEEAEEANRAKSEFLAIVSHEIRTPMTVTMAALQQVLETPLQPLQKQYLTMADKASVSLLQLINDILDFSKIEARKLELERMPFRVRECVENVVSILGVNARQKGLSLDLTCDAALPEFVLGDQHRLRQILVNLVGNAVKFTDEGRVQVQVGSAMTAPQCCEVTVAVSDTGIGIAEDRREQLFESFSQADSSTTRKYGGTGLGLAICKGLVEQMGGSIGVENRAERGCCFTFTLPLQILTRQNNEAGLRSDSGPVQGFPGMHVLLVEDDPATATLVTSLLEGFQLNVEHVADGVLAVDRCCADHFDLVLMDYQMPRMDGLAATAQIRAAGVAVPIVGLTAYVSQQERHMFITAGMDDCLSKPVDLDCLHKILIRFSPAG